MSQVDMQLTAEQKRMFLEEGHFWTRILDDDEIDALRRDIDDMAVAGQRAKTVGRNLPQAALDRMSRLVRSPLIQQVPAEGRRAYQMPDLGRLVWHPKVLSVLDQVMADWQPRAEWSLDGGLPPAREYSDEPLRSRYVFHHVNAARHDAGTAGLPWHHDYDQYPQTNRSHLMVHVLIYLNGLDGTIGDLQLVPGTQHSVASKRALWFMGWEKLPGTVVIDELPPGAAVFMNSAMFHSRCPRSGGETRPRYFIDSSYCQSGIQWPSAYSGSHTELLERHLAEGGDRPWLFDDSQFFDATPGHHLVENARGSLAANLAPVKRDRHGGYGSSDLELARERA